MEPSLRLWLRRRLNFQNMGKKATDVKDPSKLGRDHLVSKVSAAAQLRNKPNSRITRTS